MESSWGRQVMLTFPCTLMYTQAHKTSIHTGENSGGGWRNVHTHVLIGIGTEVPGMWQKWGNTQWAAAVLLELGNGCVLPLQSLIVIDIFTKDARVMKAGSSEPHSCPILSSKWFFASGQSIGYLWQPRWQEAVNLLQQDSKGTSPAHWVIKS